MATGKKKVAKLFSDLSLMADLPKKIGKGWHSLLIRLGLTEANIDHINHNHRELEDKIRDGLTRWNEENRNKPYQTRAKQLLEALRETDMTALADELEDKYCITESKESGIIQDVVQNCQKSSDVIYSREPSGVIFNTENFQESSDDNTMNTLNKTGASSAKMFLTESGAGINEEISLRGYQAEIARDGLRGENSIIWAGTGSGKTRVAVYIMKNHLDQNPEGRIAFFATTGTLLDQQYKTICEFLPMYNHQIQKFSGKDQSGESFSVVVNQCRVCVLTPDILGNCLNNRSVSLHVFSMLVFDECHHTRKNEPYNKIMAHYRKLHQEDSAAKLPQIIGLTASVGTERAWNVQGAEESILELMARMDVYKIATPRDNMEEYKKYVPDPSRRSEVMKERKTDPIKDTIERTMEQLEKWLHTEVGVLDKDVHHLLLEMPCEHRMEQQYQSWLSRLPDTLLNSKELKSHGTCLYQANVVTQHLTMYHAALRVNTVLCMKNVVDHLKHSSLTCSLLKGDKKNEVVISKSLQHKPKLNISGNETISGSVNIGVDNTGVDNIGVDNTDVDNTGGNNKGVDNIGRDSTGVDNTGGDNTGVDNTGVDNKGSYHTGSYNTGSYHTGVDNSGSYNTGVDNTGSYHTGSYNTGSYHTGVDISGSYHIGVENTENYLTGVDNTGMDITGSDNTSVGNAVGGKEDTRTYNTGVENTGHNTRSVIGDVNNTGSDIAVVTLGTLFKEVVKDVECLSMSHENENPNIVRLQEMVDEIFREKGENSTFIVFVETRESAKDVSEYLNENSVFAKCSYLISSRSATEEDQKQSLANRKRVVERLRAKELNGLVATPVAEEGLDIPSCNFVIRYNKSSNEISTLQTSGRSRAIQGTVIHFADQQKREQEEVNVMRLKLMNQAMGNILNKPFDVIRWTVDQRKCALTTAEAEEERNRQEQQAAKTQSNFTLRCWNCQAVAVSSCDIRCYNTSQYIVVGREFYNKITHRPNKKVCKYEGMIKKYKIDCKNCTWEWGMGACNDNNVVFAVLKITQFIARDDDTGMEYNRKKWKDLPFTVQTMAKQDFSSLTGVEELIEQGPDS